MSRPPARCAGKFRLQGREALVREKSMGPSATVPDVGTGPAAIGDRVVGPTQRRGGRGLRGALPRQLPAARAARLPADPVERGGRRPRPGRVRAFSRSGTVSRTRHPTCAAAWSTRRPPGIAAAGFESLKPAPAEGSTGLGADELFDVLARLPARQRAAVVLRYYEDLSDSDVAALLGSVPARWRRSCTVRSTVCGS